MSVFIVTRKSDAVEVFRYDNVVAVDWPQYPFATHNHTLHVAPPPPEPPAPPPVRITKLAFRQRFTQAERVAIEIAALDRVDATDEQRAQAAALRSYQEDVNVSEFIDLNDTDTRDGVTTLESVGLLAPGRATTILDTPMSDGEAFNG